jgi:hypothetical protein
VKCTERALVIFQTLSYVQNYVWKIMQEGVSYSEEFSKSKLKIDPTLSSSLSHLLCFLAGELLWI